MRYPFHRTTGSSRPARIRYIPWVATKPRLGPHRGYLSSWMTRPGWLALTVVQGTAPRTAGSCLACVVHDAPRAHASPPLTRCCPEKVEREAMPGRGRYGADILEDYRRLPPQPPPPMSAASGHARRKPLFHTLLTARATRVLRLLIGDDGSGPSYSRGRPGSGPGRRDPGDLGRRGAARPAGAAHLEITPDTQTVLLYRHRTTQVLAAARLTMLGSGTHADPGRTGRRGVMGRDQAADDSFWMILGLIWASSAANSSRGTRGTKP